VISYYLKIAPYLLPHLRDRPLTLKRYPNGVNSEFFYEKRCPYPQTRLDDHRICPQPREKRRIDYCVVNEPAALAWVENLASLELHTLLAKSSNLQQPTMVVFDLDPGPPAEVHEACGVALQMRDLFEKLGLKTYVKHSGGKGLHLVIPLNTKVEFDDTKHFARAVAMLFEQNDPKGVTSVMHKDLRGGKVFIDWSQNDEHKTTCCVYSLRARERRRCPPRSHGEKSKKRTAPGRWRISASRPTRSLPGH
jgi:bifunctional non-homologous end joining protein LigD